MARCRPGTRHVTRALALSISVLVLCFTWTASALAAAPAWTRQFGTTNHDAGQVAAPAPEGGAYIVASWNDGCCPNTGRTFLARYTSTGSVSWSTTLPHDGTTARSAIASDPTGVYIATEVRPTVAEPRSSIVLRKYSHAGAPLFTRPLGELGTDRRPAMASDGSKVYVAWLRGTTNLGVFRDVLIGRLEQDGTVTGLFTQQSDSEDLFLAADTSSLYLVNDVFDTTVVPGEPAVGSTDILVRRLDLAGHRLWWDRFGSPRRDRLTAIAINSKGIYTAYHSERPDQDTDLRVQRHAQDGTRGWLRRVPFINAGEVAADEAGVYLVGEVVKALAGFHRKGPSDAFARKLSNAGKVIWTAQWGTSKLDGVWAAATSSGGLFATGYTYGKFPGQLDHADQYDLDAFLTKLPTSGH